jgi:hypothetical protein
MFCDIVLFQRTLDSPNRQSLSGARLRKRKVAQRRQQDDGSKEYQNRFAHGVSFLVASFLPKMQTVVNSILRIGIRPKKIHSNEWIVKG